MKYAVADNIVMVAELMIKPEKLEAFFDYAVDNLKICRSYSGNIAFDILTDPTQPNMVIFYEVWESAEAQQAYMAWRTQGGDFTILLAFLAAAPKITKLRRIAA